MDRRKFIKSAVAVGVVLALPVIASTKYTYKTYGTPKYMLPDGTWHDGYFDEFSRRREAALEFSMRQING